HCRKQERDFVPAPGPAGPIPGPPRARTQQSFFVPSWVFSQFIGPAPRCDYLALPCQTGRRTVSTAQGACAVTFCEMLPNKRRRKPVRPRVPITTRSADPFRASSRSTAAGSPSPTTPVTTYPCEARRFCVSHTNALAPACPSCPAKLIPPKEEIAGLTVATIIRLATSANPLS